MAEYIEREALLKHKTLIPGFVGEYVHVDRVIEAPAADVLKVVRCKDCIYFELDEDEAEIDGWYHLCRNTGMGVTKNDFCSSGETEC